MTLFLYQHVIHVAWIVTSWNFLSRRNGNSHRMHLGRGGFWLHDAFGTRRFLAKVYLVGWLYWGLTPFLQLRSYHGGRWRICVSWLSHTSTNTTFLSKATDYFSHMLLQRWEAKIRRKEKSPQPGIGLVTARSWVRHAHHWATRAVYVVEVMWCKLVSGERIKVLCVMLPTLWGPQQV